MNWFDRFYPYFLIIVGGGLIIYGLKLSGMEETAAAAIGVGVMLLAIGAKD